jgi:hypothetical protein
MSAPLLLASAFVVVTNQTFYLIMQILTPRFCSNISDSGASFTMLTQGKLLFFQNFRSKNNTLKENFCLIHVFVFNICHCMSGLVFKSNKNITLLHKTVCIL